MKRAAAAILAGLLVAGCISIQAPGDGKPLKMRSLGKGCVYAELSPGGKTTIIAESDGISVNLAGMFRFVADIAGSVFGAQRMETADPLEQGEGCRGVVDQLYGASDPEPANSVGGGP